MRLAVPKETKARGAARRRRPRRLGAPGRRRHRSGRRAWGGRGRPVHRPRLRVGRRNPGSRGPRRFMPERTSWPRSTADVGGGGHFPLRHLGPQLPGAVVSPRRRQGPGGPPGDGVQLRAGAEDKPGAGHGRAFLPGHRGRLPRGPDGGQPADQVFPPLYDRRRHRPPGAGPGDGGRRGRACRPLPPPAGWAPWSAPTTCGLRPRRR